MDDLKERVIRRIGELKNEAVEFLADLVRSESVNPPGDMRAIADVITNKARTFTQNCEIVADDETVPNLFITLIPVRDRSFYTTATWTPCRWAREATGSSIRSTRSSMAT